MYHTYNELERAIDCLDDSIPQGETATNGPFGAFEILQRECLGDSHVHSLSSDQTASASPVANTDQNLDSLFREVIILPQLAEGSSESQYVEFLLFESINTEESIDVPILDSSLIEKIKCGKRLNILGRYLLVNYQHNFAPYMSVVLNSRNVWCSQCLPRVFAALSDIDMTGSTSSARLLLLYSVFATSAYCLRNKFPTASPSFRYYQNLGEQLEEYSTRCVYNCVTGTHFGKYKDFLAALLSMVIAECQTDSPSERNQLLGTIRRIVNLRLRSRPKQSSKALLLHRYCAMLVLSQKAILSDSSYFANERSLDNDEWIDKVFEDVLKPQNDILRKRVDYLQKLNSRHISLNYMETQLEFDRYFEETLGDESLIKENYEAQSWEDTFGLPGTLAYLFKEVVLLSSKLATSRNLRPGSAHVLPQHISDRATAIEIGLANWQKSYEPPRIPAPLNELSDEGKQSRYLAIISHHIEAFYEALFLYYYRVVKGVSHYLLQPTVERLVVNLEAIMHLNPVSDLKVFPFFFPGFIGACEASEKNLSLCCRFDKWQRYIEFCGPCSCQDALSEVVAVVRKYRRLKKPGSDWWILANEMNIKLSLF